MRIFTNEVELDNYSRALSLVDSQFISTDVGIMKFKRKALIKAFPKARFNREWLIEVAYLGVCPEGSALKEIMAKKI